MNNNKVLKAGIGYVVGNYLIKGLNFFTLPLFTRLLNTYEYGVYNTYVATEGILYIIIGLAIHTSYKNAWYKFGMKEEYNTYKTDTMLLIQINGIIMLSLMLFFSDFFTRVLLLDRTCLALLVVYSTCSAVLNCYYVDVSLQYKYTTYIIVAAFNAILNIFFSILLISTYFSSKPHLGRIVGTLIPVVVIALFINISYWKKARPMRLRTYLKWGLTFSLPIVPNGIGQVILSQFDRLMINKMIGPAEAGIYSFAYNIYNIINVTAISLDNVWTSWLYEKMHTLKYADIYHKSKIYILLMFIFSSIIMLISPELVIIIGSKEYFDATKCVIPLIAGSYFLFLSYLPISIEYYYAKTKIIPVATTCAAIINVGLNLLYINKFGYVIAAFTTMITYFLYFMLHYHAAKKIHGKEIFSKRTIGFCSSLIMIMLILTYILLNNCIIRICFSIFFLLLFLFIEEKNISILKKYLIHKS